MLEYHRSGKSDVLINGGGHTYALDMLGEELPRLLDWAEQNGAQFEMCTQFSF